jgi:2-polyprenyl-3-methyl-5-hydroxy-6-metoxy-1,4-benzoquinol methylase
MNIKELKEFIEGVEIYILDQILKERYQQEAIILDAGCGKGRNLRWFYQNNYKVYGVDHSESAIETVKKEYPKMALNFSIQNLDNLSFQNAFFDHILCNAVLHFAQHKAHFMHMFSELIRVLKPGGSLLIRMASLEGIEEYAIHQGNGVYFLPDETYRFLLNPVLLEELLNNYPIKLIEALKTVKVSNLLFMSTLVFQKNN